MTPTQFFNSIFLCLAVVGLAPSMAVAQSGVVISLHRAEVRCAGPSITLGQIADIRTADESKRQELSVLNVDSFDPKQDRIAVSRQQIQILLRLKGVDMDLVVVTGAEEVVAVAATQTGADVSLEDQIRNALATQYGIPPADLSILLDSQAADLKRTDLDFSSFRLSPLVQPELPLGRQTLRAMVSDSLNRDVSIKIPITLALFQDMVVAKQNLSRGATLNAGNLESVRRPVSNRNVRFASFEQVAGKQIQSDVQQYALIKPNQVESSTGPTDITVKRNALVNIIVERGSLKVVLKQAKALANGSTGDTISFMNPKTGNAIQATIIDSATAIIRL